MSLPFDWRNMREPKWLMPHTKEGNPRFGYTPSGTYYIRQFDWVKPYVFEKTLTFNHTDRFGSVAHFVWRDEWNHTYVMFMSELADMIVKGVPVTSVMSGKWTFAKRGNSYGIKKVYE